MTQHNRPSRRTVLGSILAGASAGLAGCAGLGATGSDVNTSIDVDGTDLVLTVEPDTIDAVNLISPSGELFQERTIASGASQRRIPIGVSYSPGEYEIIALSDGERVATSTVTLEPELELTELRFEGDLPNPTPDWYDTNEDSGIYDEENGFGDADAIPIAAGETILVYSNTRPFSTASARLKCDHVEQDGQFTVRVGTAHEFSSISRRYAIHYTGESPDSCDFDIEAIE